MGAKKIEVTLAKTTKINKKFVFAGDKIKVTEEEKKSLIEKGLVDSGENSGKVTQSQKEITALREELAAKVEEVSTIADELAEMSGSNSTLTEQLEALTSDNSVLQEQIDTLTADDLLNKAK